MASKALLSQLQGYISALADRTDLSVPSLFYAVASIAAVTIAIIVRTSDRSNVAYLNPKKALDFGNRDLKKEFTINAVSMIAKWFTDNPETPVAVNSDMGVMTVLPSTMANEIATDNRLAVNGLSEKFFHASLPGFEAFRDDGNSALMRRVVTKNLSKEQNKVTEPLAEEASQSLADILTDNPEWHQINVRDSALHLVARISSSVFLGQELCRNEDWLKVTREYTVASMMAADTLRGYPVLLRPIMNRYLALCRENRRLLKAARDVIEPVVRKRREMKAEARAAGKEAPDFNDALEWFEINAPAGGYDPSLAQIMLSVAGIHTTTDLATQTLLDIAQHPEIIEPLRQEITSVLRDAGWTKKGLYEMKLLDSVIKESQRVKPISVVSMTRIATEEIVLSDGTVIPKDRLIAVHSTRMWDEKLHGDAAKWDAYRFYNMRGKAEKRHLAHLAFTNQDHLAFGHGDHACPGRFFAASEIKVMIANVLLNYDIRLPEGQKVNPMIHGLILTADPFASLEVKRRTDTEA